MNDSMVVQETMLGVPVDWIISYHNYSLSLGTMDHHQLNKIKLTVSQLSVLMQRMQVQ